MNESAESIVKQYEICYAYNDFGFYYKIPMTRKDCEVFVANRNECKGGHWEVRRKIDYQEHFEALKGKIFAGDGSVFLE